jgi:hypothetical protein
MDTSKEELDIGNVAMNSLGEVGVIEQKSTLCRARACGFIYYGHRIDDQMRHWQGINVYFLGEDEDAYHENGGEERAAEQRATLTPDPGDVY